MILTVGKGLLSLLNRVCVSEYTGDESGEKGDIVNTAPEGSVGFIMASEQCHPEAKRRR